MENDQETPERLHRWRKFQVEAARLLASGLPVAEVAVRVNRSRTTVYGWTGLPGWDDLMVRARAGVKAEAEAELGLARPAAVRALRGILDRSAAEPAAVGSGDVVRAATALLSASAPPSEAQRDRARREMLDALPAALRAEVVKHLDGWADLETLSDAELDARLAAAEGGAQ